MLLALPSASAATVDVASGATVAAGDDDADADGAVVPQSLKEDEGAYVGASVEFEVTCFGVFVFADGA